MTLDQNARALRLDMKLDFKYYVAPENLDMCDVVRSTAWAATRVIDERIGTKSYSFGSITSKINVDRVNNIFSFYIDLTPNFDEYMPIDDQMRCECYPYLIGTNYRYLDRANKIISGLGPVTGISVPGKQLPFILSNLSKIEARDVKDFYVKLRPSFIEESGRADRLKEIAASY